jgi:hypothetical protein
MPTMLVLDVTAVHEAAHAVINHALGISTIQLWVDSTDDSAGMCEPADLLAPFRKGGNLEMPSPRTDLDDYGRAVSALKRHAIASLAGPAMEWILAIEGNALPLRDFADFAEDYSKARADIGLILKWEPVDQQACDEYFAAVEAQARRLLLQPTIRQAVDLLGKRLSAARRFNGSEVLELLEDEANLRFGIEYPAFCSGSGYSASKTT